MTIFTYKNNPIKAFYTPQSVRVYQAYSTIIANSAVKNNTFVSPPFSMTRMTWIKPSFLWMMYRSGWGMKDRGQERILAIDITHDGFREILQQGVISHYDPDLFNSQEEWKKEVQQSDVVIQWDPERDIHLNKLEQRTIQIGLRNQAVEHYVNQWIINIEDITSKAHRIHELVKMNKLDMAYDLLPEERIYLG
ncbi:DUF4291 domain-containing protein [Xenorhabdus griffiniae]|uniref:DUF4291 domain-containing protein n=1 Tax=Xenorhabdus griffiniae TaxID=351672 RepID=A0ABY9XJU8_9GAMM|nr:DUF4291 domain-containing protein [Xenorhabdus griffiniae]MBD1226563.1 DUF4291 domain-containing protein [Xenorhabdus griffiniae]MBE8587385.1 DUF4291 domain-containing protein [Xenorhabdus griffiniae]WMV73207.1 DUF4291 domain-containing protein [Xenorhabdus griffiniae]WNH02886.1 DUF4291 domain-containing protein [Xenorhabdus griffiniae]